MRTAALRGAILTRQEDGLPLLAQALHSDDFTLVLAAARTAQEMPGSQVTRLLAGELAGLPADRQILVIQTLAKRAMMRPCPLCSPPPGTARSPFAWRPFARWPRSATPQLSQCSSNCWAMPTTTSPQAAQESLAALPGKEVDAAIMAMLADGAAARRITAMDLIVRRRMTSAIPALFDAAGGSDAKLRTAAVKKLGELAGPAELPASARSAGQGKESRGPGSHGASLERGQLEGSEA